MTMTEALQRLKLSWPGKTVRVTCDLSYHPDASSLPSHCVQFTAVVSQPEPYRYIGCWTADTLEELCILAAGAEVRGGIRADDATAGLATCEEA